MTTSLDQRPPGVLAQQRSGSSNWSWELAGDILPDFLDALWITIQITLLGLLIAVTLGLVLAILRRSRFRIVRWPVGVIVEFIRSTPLIVQLFFLFYVLPDWDLVLHPWEVAIYGLGVHYACYMSESYRAGIDAVPSGQWEASTALNLSAVTTWREVVLPQAIPTVIPALGNYMVAAIKDAPVASIVTVFTILGAAQDAQANYATGLVPFTMAGVLFLAVSIPMASFARFLERRYGYQRD